MPDRTRRRLLRLPPVAMAVASLAGKGRAEEPAEERADLLVIGAGAAGLAAAAAAAAGGARVLVLEARERIGGRVLSDRSLGPPLELGAGWIHGARGNPLSALAASAGLRPEPETWAPWEVFAPGGRALSARAVERGEARLAEALARASRRAGGEESLAGALARLAPELAEDAGAAWYLAAFVEFSAGGPAGALSAALWNAGADFGDDDTRVPEGMDRLLPPLPDGVTLSRRAEVRLVEHGARGVRAHLADGRQVEAGGCILAVPSAVLASGALRLEPGLPPAQGRALAAQGRGAVAKLVLAFPRRFWPRGLRGFGLASPVPEGPGRWPLWLSEGRAASGAHLLMGVATGAHALRADRMETGALVADGLAALSEGLGTRPPAPLAHLRSRWGAEPFSGLAYSFPRAGGGREDFDALSAPSGPRLWLAGEHAAFDHRATLHGAILSGRRAAAAALR